MAIGAVLVGTKGSNQNGTVVTGSGTSTASGSTFAVCVAWGFQNITGVTDSKSNTYTQAGTTQVVANMKCAVYLCQNGTGGASHTATITFNTTGNFATGYLIEVTGATTASFDQIAQTTDSASPYTVTTPTLSQAAELILTMTSLDGGGSVADTPSSSNTTIIGSEPDGSAYYPNAVSKVIVAATTAFTPSFTYGGTTNGTDSVALIATTFKELAAGGATAPTKVHHYKMQGIA